MKVLSLRFELPSAAVVCVVASLAVGCSSDTSASDDRRDQADGKDAAQPPGKIQHFGTFTPTDLYAGGETEVRDALALNGPGCLTLDDTLVAFPKGSKVVGDGAIRMPDGKVLRWWIPTSMSTFPTHPNKHTANQPSVGIVGLEKCDRDPLTPVTLVTFLPDS